MREIKFRGKNSQGEWYYGGITADKKFIVSQFTFLQVRPETVGQFTGFFDANDMEIYEGDVVTINNVPYVAKWFNQKGCFIFKNDVVLVSMLNADTYKIIGNIYDDEKFFGETK